MLTYIVAIFKPKYLSIGPCEPFEPCKSQPHAVLTRQISKLITSAPSTKKAQHTDMPHVCMYVCTYVCMYLLYVL